MEKRDVTISKHLAELLVGVCNELIGAWPDPSDAISEEQSLEFQENLAKITSIRDDLAKCCNLRNDLGLP